MIIIHSLHVNIDTHLQAAYSSIICSIDLTILKCPSCSHIGTTVHGYYTHQFFTEDGKISILIKRVKCRHCGKTHALLLSCFVPYYRLPMDSILLIIKEKKLRTIQQLHTLIPYVSVEYILYILRLFKRYWKDRIDSYFIPIDDLIHKRCIDLFNKPFMQSRNCSISFM